MAVLLAVVVLVLLVVIFVAVPQLLLFVPQLLLLVLLSWFLFLGLLFSSMMPLMAAMGMIMFDGCGDE